MENKFISFPQAAQKFSIGLKTPQYERFNVGLNGIKISPTNNSPLGVNPA